MMKFKELAIGENFDFDGGINPTWTEKCIKTGNTTYTTGKDFWMKCRVGTVNVEVYHYVERYDAAEVKPPCPINPTANLSRYTQQCQDVEDGTLHGRAKKELGEECTSFLSSMLDQNDPPIRQEAE